MALYEKAQALIADGAAICVLSAEELRDRIAAASSA
jgi:hypothetical protein